MVKKLLFYKPRKRFRFQFPLMSSYIRLCNILQITSIDNSNNFFKRKSTDVMRTKVSKGAGLQKFTTGSKDSNKLLSLKVRFLNISFLVPFLEPTKYFIPLRAARFVNGSYFLFLFSLRRQSQLHQKYQFY